MTLEWFPQGMLYVCIRCGRRWSSAYRNPENQNPEFLACKGRTCITEESAYPPGICDPSKPCNHGEVARDA